jgi:chromosome segregation ATPase
MTLKEAYELMRKELWSLRAENKRLQKQLEKHTESAFPAEEKERLERHIHHLEQVCQTSESRYQDALKSIRVAERHRQDLEMQIPDLNEQVSSLQEENAALIKELSLPNQTCSPSAGPTRSCSGG